MMKKSLMVLMLLLCSFLYLPLATADQWPYGTAGYDDSIIVDEDDEENSEYFPLEGESMPEMEEDDFDEDDDDYSQDDEVDDVNSIWLDNNNE